MSNCKLVCKPTRSRPRKFNANDVKRIINKALENDTPENVCAAISAAMENEKGESVCAAQKKQCGDLLRYLVATSNTLKKILNNTVIQSIFSKLATLQEFGYGFWDNVFSIGGLIKQFYPSYLEENPIQPVFLPALIPPAAILSNIFGVLSIVKLVLDKIESLREIFNLMSDVSQILNEVIQIMLNVCEHDYNNNVITTDPTVIDDQGNIIDFDPKDDREEFI
jgi:hypothetical protein